MKLRLNPATMDKWDVEHVFQKFPKVSIMLRSKVGGVVRKRCTNLFPTQYVNRWYRDCRSSCSASLRLLKAYSCSCASHQRIRSQSLLYQQGIQAQQKRSPASGARSYEIAFHGEDDGGASTQLLLALTCSCTSSQSE